MLVSFASFRKESAARCCRRIYNSRMLTPRFGLRFEDFYRVEGLQRIDAAFVGFLGEIDTALKDRLLARGPSRPRWRRARNPICWWRSRPPGHSCASVRHRGGGTGAARHHALAPLHTVKRLFVQRRAIPRWPRKRSGFDPSQGTGTRTRFGEKFSEIAFATHVTAWLKDGGITRKHSNLRSAMPHGRCLRRRKGGIVPACCSRRRRSSTSPTRALRTRSDEDSIAIADGHLRRGRVSLTDPGTDLTGRSIRRTIASGATSRARIRVRAD